MSMSLKARISEDVKQAMRAQDKPRLGVLRLISAAIKQREVDERIELDDAQVLSVIEKMIKQRRESIAQFEKAARNDLVDAEKFELGVLAGYLPQQMTDAEISQAVEMAISEAKPAGIKDMGKVMAVLKPRLAGRADMAKVSTLVKSKLSG